MPLPRPARRARPIQTAGPPSIGTPTLRSSTPRIRTDTTLGYCHFATGNGDGSARDANTRTVECSSVESAVTHVHEMPAAERGRARSFPFDAGRLRRIDGAEIELRPVVARSAGTQGDIEKMAAISQKDGPAVTVGTLAVRHAADRCRCAAKRVYPIEGPIDVRREHDDVGSAPGAAARSRCVGQNLDRAAPDLDRFQFAIGK